MSYKYEMYCVVLYYIILYYILIYYNHSNRTNISLFLFFLFLYYSINICQRGNTALMVAACNGHTDVITYLLEKGANVNAINLVSESVGEGLCGREEGLSVCVGEERGVVCVWYRRGEGLSVCVGEEGRGEGCVYV